MQIPVPPTGICFCGGDNSGHDIAACLVYVGVMDVKDFKYRLRRFLLLSMLGLAIGGAIAYVSVLQERQTETSSSHGGMIATAIGGPFDLVDQDGITRSEKDYAGKYKLIYFGFTYCPAICPTELSKMAEAYLSLTAEERARIQPIFITVDPERDTPEVMKGYVGLFMPQLAGLTGTSAQIENVKSAFKVYAAKVPQEGGDADDYTVDHSSLIYYLAPDGQVIAMFKTADTAQQIAVRMKELFGLD